MVKYKIGDIIKCKVTGIENYGIFVSVDEIYSGLIHISEITYNFVRNIRDYTNVGDIIYGKILGIDENECKMKLSIKDLDYKNTGRLKKIIESETGFKPLEDMLPKWTIEKLNEFKKEEENK